MLNIKSYRSIKQDSDKMATKMRKDGKKFERYEVESYAEIKTVEQIRDYYAEKTIETEKKQDELLSRVKFLEGKVINAISERESNKYVDQVTDLDGTLLDAADDVESFKNIYKTLKELYDIAVRLRNKGLYWEVVKLIPERKLVSLVRDRKGFRYLRELVNKTIEDLRATERLNREYRKESDEQNSHNISVHAQHAELVNVNRNALRDKRRAEILAGITSDSKINKTADINDMIKEAELVDNVGDTVKSAENITDTVKAAENTDDTVKLCNDADDTINKFYKA